MSITWIIDEGSFSHEQRRAMVDHLVRRGVPHLDVRTIPFHDRLWSEPFGLDNIKGHVVAYGRDTLRAISKRYGWSPGVWYDKNRFRYSTAHALLGELTLSPSIEVLPLSEVVKLVLMDVPMERFFIRPDFDSKFFSGMIISRADMIVWDKKLRRAVYTDNDPLVVVADVQEIISEWRCVVVDGQLVETSCYAGRCVQAPTRHHDEAIADLVREANRRFCPADVYVVDVAMNGEGELKIVEYNSFNSSGLYACDVGRIIDAINYMLENKT